MEKVFWHREGFRSPVACKLHKPQKNECMGNVLIKLWLRAGNFREALKEESGQDLVEYALIIAVLCFGVLSAMGTLANGIVEAMETLSTTLKNVINT
jgi:Flp pilus assembly pilin Flp